MKKIIISCILLLLIVACVKPKETMQNEYVSCNNTSNGNMIETESGYYYVYNSIIYYADKSNLNNWVPVCNKPNCIHQDRKCNAFLDVFSGITQKDGQIYGVSVDFTDGPYVYEIAMDGSGQKKTYDIPLGENVNINSFKGILFQNQLVMYYGYLAEDGRYHNHLARLEEDGSLKIIYKEVMDNDESGAANLAATSVGVRGDKAILSTLLTKTEENFLNVLWRIDGDEPERVNLSDDIDITWGYLSDDTFTYFKQQEGFYKVDLVSGEQELIMENQLEDSRGIVLTEKYLIEMNRYKGYMPEEAYLKFYNGTEWLDVKLPDEVKNAEDTFTVLSVASDRIFMAQAKDEQSSVYYFMLNEDTPELVYCDEISKYREEENDDESKEVSTEQEILENAFEPITVFDNEDFLFQVTGMYTDTRDRLKITTYWENKSNKEDYTVYCTYATINGLMSEILQGAKIKSNEKWEDVLEQDKTFKIDFDKSPVPNFTDRNWFEIQNLYNPEEYTDITLYFQVAIGFDTIGEQTVHIYPYGEEHAIKYEREEQDTDIVLVDEESLTILVRGYEDGIIPNGNIKLFFINKTDQRIRFEIDELYVNGMPLKHNLFTSWLYYIPISPDCSAFHTLASDYFSNALAEHRITNLEEVKFHCRVYPTDYIGEQIGEDWINETFTLTP